MEKMFEELRKLYDTCSDGEKNVFADIVKGKLMPTNNDLLNKTNDSNNTTPSKPREKKYVNKKYGVMSNFDIGHLQRDTGLFEPYHESQLNQYSYSLRVSSGAVTRTLNPSELQEIENKEDYLNINFEP